jgi:hypothetical protein
MVCVKRGAVIEADKPIHSQLRLINFSEGSPYETLHAFISKTMAPYFKSYVKESGRADRSVYVCGRPRPRKNSIWEKQYFFVGLGGKGWGGGPCCSG